MRGIDQQGKAQKIIDVMRSHYYFVIEHSSIKKTPMEQAWIDRIRTE